MNISDLHRRVEAVEGFIPPLLDLFPNATNAYSLRLLNSEYTGNCIEVRRSLDNTFMNIGFKNGFLDIESLLIFVGGSNGFVKTWYDQSGNNRHATQTNNNLLPILVVNGVINTYNGKISILNQNTNASIALSYPNIITNDLTNFDYFFTNGTNSNQSVGILFSDVAARYIGAIQANSTNTILNENVLNPVYRKNGNVVNLTNRNDSYQIYHDNNINLVNISWTSIMQFASQTINSYRNSNSFSAIVNYNEIVMYNFDQTNNRIKITENINNYWNLY